LADIGLIGAVQAPQGSPGLALFVARAFRELVAFTPPHRHAVCLEPYTCATDAINLQAQGIDAGLRVLQPGERWHAAVVLTFNPG
jgi:aldose 1-epimerase